MQNNCSWPQGLPPNAVVGGAGKQVQLVVPAQPSIQLCQSGVMPAQAGIQLVIC